VKAGQAARVRGGSMAISDKRSWIEDSDVVSLFPTLVWKIQLRAEVHEPIDAGALDPVEAVMR